MVSKEALSFRAGGFALPPAPRKVSLGLFCDQCNGTSTVPGTGICQSPVKETTRLVRFLICPTPVLLDYIV